MVPLAFEVIVASSTEHMFPQAPDGKPCKLPQLCNFWGSRGELALRNEVRHLELVGGTRLGLSFGLLLRRRHAL